MAMSPPPPLPSGQGRVKNLTCRVCHDTFRTPKLLPCFHTVCLHCVEGLARAHGPQSFPCPECRTTIHLPPGGAHQFQDNVYISEEELERKGTAHDTETAQSVSHCDSALEYFCVKCSQVICLECKLTKHLLHLSEDLSEAAKRSEGQLLRLHERLERSIDGLAKISGLAVNNRKAAREKAKALREHVCVQHLAMIKRADELHNMVLEGLDDVAENIDRDLEAEERKVQAALDSFVELQQQVGRVLNKATDVEIVAVEKEMRKEKEGLTELTKLDDLIPRNTPRPGIHSYARSLKESLERDVLLYFGSPVKLLVPNVVEAPEIITAFHRCGTDDVCREVHAIYRADDGKLYVAYGGEVTQYVDEMLVHPDRSGVETEEVNFGTKISFDKSRTKPEYILPADGYGEIHANSNVDFRIVTRLFHSKETRIERQSNGVALRNAVSFEINDASKPRGFDANAAGDLFVVISEEDATLGPDEAVRKLSINSFSLMHGNTSKKEVQRDIYQRTLGRRNGRKDVLGISVQVRLYRKNLSDPIDTYISPTRHFLPTAVSFWEVGRQELLLIADWLNDSVHVARVESGKLRFVRFLHATGSGDLVRPTALDVDSGGSIWIGCETGWILRCKAAESLREEEESLEVENRSRTTTVDTDYES